MNRQELSIGLTPEEVNEVFQIWVKERHAEFLPVVGNDFTVSLRILEPDRPYIGRTFEVTLRAKREEIAQVEHSEAGP